jgi:hypothetical protein
MWEILAHEWIRFASRTIEKLGFDYREYQHKYFTRGSKKVPEFFDRDGLVHHEFVPHGQNVSGNVYVQMLQRLRDAVRRKRCGNWQGQWFLLHDNAPSHTSLVLMQFLAEKNIPVITQPPYLFNWSRASNLQRNTVSSTCSWFSVNAIELANLSTLQVAPKQRTVFWFNLHTCGSS